MKKQSGFSMLEVLVSLIIILLGALGMAGIQMLSINNTEIARYQSLAALLASSMAAEIQGNKAFWNAQTGISATGGVVSGGPSGGACGTGCSPSQVAGNSLQTWADSIAGVLPSGATGTVNCSNTPAVCAVQLQWTENNVALNNPAGTGNYQFSAGKQSAQSYKTVVTVR